MDERMSFDEAIRVGVEASESDAVRVNQVSEIFRDAAASVFSYLGKRAEFCVRGERRNELGLEVDGEWHKVCEFEQLTDVAFPVRLRYASVIGHAHDADELREEFVKMLSSPHFGRILLGIKNPNDASNDATSDSVSALSCAIRQGEQSHGVRTKSRQCVRSVVYDVGHAVSMRTLPYIAVASIVPAGHLHVVTPPTLVLFIEGKQYTVCEWHEGASVFPVTMKTADGQVYQASDEKSLSAQAKHLLSSQFFARLMRKILDEIDVP